MKLHNRFVLSGFFLISCLAGSQAMAKQGGDQYPHGSEGFMAGAVPPAGDYMMVYGVDYRGTLMDNGGDEVKVNNDDIDIHVNALSLRWIHVTETKILNGDFGFHVIAPLMKGKINVAGDTTSMSGLGDMVVDPFIAWHYPNLHLVAGVDIFLPTGKFDKDKAINPGAGYWSVEPLLGVTYLSDSGYEASVKLMYNIKSENKDTDTLSGDEFHMDYALTKHDGPWSYGIGGYYVKQIQNDEVDGVKVKDSKRRSLAIGPQIKYDYKNMSFVGKYQVETASRNTFEGNRVNLKFIYSF